MYASASLQNSSLHGLIRYHSQMESAEIQFVTGKSWRGFRTSGRTSTRTGISMALGSGRVKSV